MNILITGGAGFLGANLARSLIEDGHSVTSMDNFHSGRKENLISCEDSSSFQSITHDIRKPLDMSDNIDQIYHLACPASPKFYQADPIYTTETCVVGTLNVLNFALKKNAKILFTSTSEVYGDPEVHPQPESYWGKVNPNGIRSCYDESKRSAETLFFDYERQHGINIKVARIFNTYGPNMHPNDGRVVSNFIIQALTNKPITVYGDGTQTRSFCYVDDLIEAFIKLMDSPDNFSGPVNTGNPEEFSILELAKKVIKMTGSKSIIDLQPLPQDDPTQRQPDITLAKEKLNWRPQINLEIGLQKTIEYFKKII